MESLHLLIIVSLCSFLVGSALGAFLTVKFASSERKNRDLEKHLHDKQDEIKKYRNEVTDHFIKTSNLLNNLTESYRDIHNHLALSANHLSNQGVQQTPIIKKLPEQEASKVTETVPPSPPLDYAPKSTPYDKGFLAHDYGLEKVELAEKPIENVAQTIVDHVNTKP